jgi:hypothetical protein
MYPDFKELLSTLNAHKVKYLDSQKGLSAFMLSREDLITAKLAAGRPQDLADVDAIRKAEEAQTKRPG